jgi:hypothetical protein
MPRACGSALSAPRSEVQPPAHELIDGIWMTLFTSN